MLKLNTSAVSPGATTLRYLASKQSDIDGKIVGLRVGRAQTLWDAKRSSNPGKVAFDEVKQLLVGLCVSTELCNYCEHNEATDIEHIYPKSFFPERTFQWPNYLLACKTCNTHYKLDQFAVFSPALSSTAVAMQRKHLPSATDAAFIDPRIEDPMYYLFLDIKGKSFHFVPHPDRTDPRDIAKAERTLAVLQIGQRPSLTSARRAALDFYLDKLERYRDVHAAKTWRALERLVRDPHWLTKSNGLAAERQHMLDNLKKSILEHQHPTVWREMQRQYPLLKKTKELFDAVPDALHWK